MNSVHSNTAVKCWLVDRRSFAVRGFWALWDNIYECVCVDITVGMAILLRVYYIHPLLHKTEVIITSI
jgi:hypothetical protein